MNKEIKYRAIENLHIVFWLFKDASWAANLRWLGMVMIVPTLAVAIFLLLRNWESPSERYHNLAVACWILANSMWMTGEFFGWDEHPPYLRDWCLLPFGVGILCVLWYYLVVRKIKM